MVVYFNVISPAAVVLIAVVALLIFGPKKLPELGRSVGVTLREFKKGTKGLIDEDEDEKKNNVVIEQKSPQIEQNNVQTDSKEQENAK